jgi:hypothetical protein
MTTPYNPIALHQTEIAARLRADEYFSDIVVVTERQGNIQGMIDRALSTIRGKDSKSGAAVIVGLFSADADNPNMPGPSYPDSGNLVQVWENPVINTGTAGTGKAAVDIAARIAQVLHHYYAAGIGQTMLVQGDNAIQPIPLRELPSGTIGYYVRVSQALDALVLDKVEIPEISVDGLTVPQTVTLSCGTAGASIYYTLDRSYPWAGDAGNPSTATLYTEPFDIETAAMLRVVAHKTNMAASDAAAAEFTD